MNRVKLGTVLNIGLWVAAASILALVLLFAWEKPNPYGHLGQFKVAVIQGCEDRTVIFLGHSGEDPPDVIMLYKEQKLVCYIYHVEEDYYVVKEDEVKLVEEAVAVEFIKFFVLPCLASGLNA